MLEKSDSLQLRSGLQMAPLLLFDLSKIIIQLARQAARDLGFELFGQEKKYMACIGKLGYITECVFQL